MKEPLATIHFTAFSRPDADAHVERLAQELHAVRSGIFAAFTARGMPTVMLRPAWLRGELATLPPHQIEMAHTLSDRHDRIYCTTTIGVRGSPSTSPDEEPMPDTVRACPSSRTSH